MPSAKVLPRNNDSTCIQIAMEEEDDYYATEGVYGGSNYAESRLAYMPRDKEVAEATTSPNLRESNPIVTLLAECSAQRSPPQDYNPRRDPSVKGHQSVHSRNTVRVQYDSPYKS